MALAGIDTLLIQASYSQRPAESRCLGTGQGGGGGLRRRFQSQRCDVVPLPALLLQAVWTSCALFSHL